MMDTKRLWAKSKKNNEPELAAMFLAQHLNDTYLAAERVLSSTANDQLVALGLPLVEYRERFQRIVLLSAALHDIGKANNHFQEMIRGKRIVQQNPQGLRHEWVTILMLQELRGWLLPALHGNETDFAIVEWSIAGHHPSANHQCPPRLCPSGAGTDIALFMGHSDYAASLAFAKGAFGLGNLSTVLTNQTCNLVGAGNVFERLAKHHRNAMGIWDKLKKLPDRMLIAASKNCLIAADVAGSALPRVKKNETQPLSWITTSFADKPQPGDLQAVVDFRLNGAAPRAFQIEVSNSSAQVTYVKAGCGTGKTLAAYLWAAKNYPTRRLYFCYPTTGTATEGFRDYLFDEAQKTPRVGADLFHGRSDIDFDLILTAGSDGRSPSEEEAGLDALRAWRTPIVGCTLDTVLGIVQNNRRGLFAWPALAQSAFVFDEIHAYDDRLFGALLRFLRDLPGLPVLLMSASLPKAREEALRATLNKRKCQLNPIAGPANLEELPRYHRVVAADNDPISLVVEKIGAGAKVLWVCNTVSRVMEAAERAVALNPLIYHSRFKYVHRVERHQDVIEAFKQKRPALAICSQVAEMSLDLSADLLVSDLATVPSLIQRLGRLNRRAERIQPTKPFVIIEPEDHLPYTPADLVAAREWLEKLPHEQLSQKHLVDFWEQSFDHQPELVGSAWLDGGPCSTVTELREASPGITVLMPEDVTQIQANQKELGRYLLPMPPPPRRYDWKSWPRKFGLPVAESGSIHYDEKRGATWEK